MSFFSENAEGLLGAGGSLVNGILGLFSTNKTNKTNRAIADSVNASNERINQSQLDYNWDMWNAQNEYNNPSAQRQRLVDAGLNPIYYGLDGNSAASGNAFSPVSAQQASPTIPQNFDAFGDAFLKYAQIKNLEADTKQKQSNSGLTDEQAENLRQLRSGMLTIQGQQIQLNIDQHDLNSAKRSEILASVESIKQSVSESQQRIDDLRSQISNREFMQKIAQAQYELDEKYKSGLLNLQELELAKGWFDSYTDRMNASTNYYNAVTSRMSARGQLYDMEQTRGYRKGFLGSMSHFNRTNAQFVHDRNKREQGVYKFDYVTRAADAFSSVCDALFKPFNNASSLIGKSLDNASKVGAFIP